jgi:hypothetical protein
MAVRIAKNAPQSLYMRPPQADKVPLLFVPPNQSIQNLSQPNPHILPNFNVNIFVVDLSTHQYNSPFFFSENN